MAQKFRVVARLFCSDAGTKQPVIVEYCSANLAKPLHLGHLRSIVIGNFVSNLLCRKSYEVIRINYHGDWGKQLCVLVSEILRHRIPVSDLEKIPMRKILDFYVNGTLAQHDVSQLNHTLEYGLGQPAYVEAQQICNVLSKRTILEMKHLFNLLNIPLPVNEYESYYVSDTLSLLKFLKGNDKLINCGDSGLGIETEIGAVTLFRNDGTSLYLARDLAAAVRRKHLYNFGRMLYVVEENQRKHFLKLRACLSSLGYDWAKDLQHLSFGRIQGLSSRSGSAVLVSDLIQSAQDRFNLHLTDTSVTNSEVRSHLYGVSQQLSFSTLFINLLKKHRVTQFKLNVDEFLKVASASKKMATLGMRFQYCHCRLSTLATKCSERFPSICSSPQQCHETEFQNMLKLQHELSDEALDLCQLINKYDSVISCSLSTLDSYDLVDYLDQLVSAINVALRKLSVLHAADYDIGRDRLILFERARRCLCDALQLLGLTPLTEL